MVIVSSVTTSRQVVLSGCLTCAQLFGGMSSITANSRMVYTSSRIVDDP
jgi:hypothetical protein